MEEDIAKNEIDLKDLVSLSRYRSSKYPWRPFREGGGQEGDRSGIRVFG